MKTLIIKSDSEKKTMLLTQYAEDLGLVVQSNNFIALNANNLAMGIGRKATDEELIDYLDKNENAEPIDLETAFSKYTNE